jgi:nicotinate-nucleotide adenylyltransferase
VAATVAILGGTFDPVHNAHLAIARLAREQLRAERVLWLPTGTPPYRTAPIASGEDRLAMLNLALADEPAHAIDARELAAGASGYTYDSMRSLAAEQPATDFVLVMGGDQYEKRESWHRWRELEKLCRIAVVERPGAATPDGGFIRLAMASRGESSSAVRARLKRGEDVSRLVPVPVLAYINQKGLYR